MSLSQLPSAGDLKHRLDAERRGTPFLLFRDEDGGQRIVELAGARDRVTIGRHSGNDVALTWDGQVSGLHAALERFGGTWTVVDDGLSRNGSYLNRARVSGRRRLADGDALRVGATTIAYREPAASGSCSPTAAGTEHSERPRLSETQRNVLIALCRPLRDTPHASPSTNREIAAELFLSVDAVKVHLRALYARFAIEDLPQNKKRARLVELALEHGVVLPRDLWP
jgi:FHA domain-containing protein